MRFLCEDCFTVAEAKQVYIKKETSLSGVSFSYLKAYLVCQNCGAITEPPYLFCKNVKAHYKAYERTLNYFAKERKRNVLKGKRGLF